MDLFDDNRPSVSPAGAPSPESGGQSIDLKALWSVVLKRKAIIVIVFALVVAITAAHNMRQVPIYQAEASMIIESMTPRVLSGVDEVVPMGTESFWGNQEFYQTEYRIMQSRAMAARVVKKLGLDHDPKFLGLQALVAAGDEAALQKAFAAAQPIDLVMGKMSIQPVRDSKMFLVQFRDTDPERAAQLANALTESYIEFNLERRMLGTKTAAEWLTEQMGDLTGRLETSELALYNFKKDNAILAQSFDDRNDQLKKHIDALSADLFAAHSKRLSIKARMDEIERAGNDPKLRAALPDVAGNDAVKQLRSVQLELSKDIVILEQRYGDKHPKLLESKEQLATLDAQIAERAEQAIAVVAAEYRVISRLEGELQSALHTAELEALELNKKGIDYNKLKREAENTTRLYGVVMSRLKETDLTGLLRTNNARVVDPALVPRGPVWPKTQTNLMISLLAGLVLGIAIAFAIEFLDSSVKTESDIKDVLGLTFLGVVPDVESTDSKKPGIASHERDFYVYEKQRSQVAECCRTIRSNILFMSADKPIKKLLVVSARPEDGKTTNAINLATTMALSGGRTLLVDTDMRRPRLHRAFGVGADLGLSNVLVGDRTLTEVTRQTEIANLDLLPCGPVPPAPSELLHSEAFNRLIEEMSRKYDRIIFDSSPMAAVTDASILSTHVDGVVLVVRAGVTSKDLVRVAIGQLRRANARILGAVLNGVDLRSRTYGYYYTPYERYKEAPAGKVKG